MCPKGYASETGLALFMSGLPIRRPSGCQPCPSGYFQEIQGQNYCMECPNKAQSRNNREATISVYECEGITRLNWDSKVEVVQLLYVLCLAKIFSYQLKYNNNYTKCLHVIIEN